MKFAAPLVEGRLVREAVEGGLIGELAGYGSIRPEVAFGEERSRIDLLLEDAARPACYVEVMAWRARVTPKAIAIDARLAVNCP